MIQFKSIILANNYGNRFYLVAAEDKPTLFAKEYAKAEYFT